MPSTSLYDKTPADVSVVVTVWLLLVSNRLKLWMLTCPATQRAVPATRDHQGKHDHSVETEQS